MAKIRTALIGCGSISKVHLDALSHMDNVELVSVADVKENRAKARAEQYGCAYTTDWTEYVSRDDIDVVHICTPHYLHAPMAIALLDSGKRVLTEKPMASEVADAEEMIRHSDGRLAVVFQNRYNEASQFIRQSIADGRYGKLLSMRAAVNWHRTPEYYTESGWRGFYKTEGGGVLINQAIHTLDLVDYLTGGVESLSGFDGKLRDTDAYEVEDSAMALMKLKSGGEIVAFCSNCYLGSKVCDVELRLEKAVMTVRQSGLTIIEEDGNTIFHPAEVLTGEKSEWGVSHGVLINEFYKSLKDGVPFIADCHTGLAAVSIVNAIQHSKGRSIKIER